MTTVHGLCSAGHALAMQIEQESQTGEAEAACPICNSPVHVRVRRSTRIHLPERQPQWTAREAELEARKARSRTSAAIHGDWE